MGSRLLPGLLLALALSAPGLEAAAQRRVTHTIQPGETPINVARKYGVPVDDLLRFNDISSERGFIAGETLEIPREGEAPSGTYVVRPGDSIARIANHHGVSQADLRAANNLGRDATLQPGQELAIPDTLRGGASRGHVVQSGDTMSAIANRYGVSVARLADANRMNAEDVLAPGRTLAIPDKDDGQSSYKPKKSDRLVTSGRKVPGGVRHTVQPGQNLWVIARAYNVGGDRIARANGFDKDEPLRIGQNILIPGARNPVPVRVKGFTVQPVRVVRVWNDETITVRLMTSSGRINPKARRELSRLAQARRGKPRFRLLHPSLIHMLQRVAERWPGHTIEIISGYRPRERGRESRHAQGRAVDFRVRGIPNREVYEFCTELPRSGCGYYPNSVFVHMDSRDKSATWTDRSKSREASD